MDTELKKWFVQVCLYFFFSACMNCTHLAMYVWRVGGEKGGVIGNIGNIAPALRPNVLHCARPQPNYWSVWDGNSISDISSVLTTHRVARKHVFCASTQTFMFIFYSYLVAKSLMLHLMTHHDTYLPLIKEQNSAFFPYTRTIVAMLLLYASVIWGERQIILISKGG